MGVHSKKLPLIHSLSPGGLIWPHGFWKHNLQLTPPESHLAITTLNARGAPVGGFAGPDFRK